MSDAGFRFDGAETLVYLGTLAITLIIGNSLFSLREDMSLEIIGLVIGLSIISLSLCLFLWSILQGLKELEKSKHKMEMAE